MDPTSFSPLALRRLHPLLRTLRHSLRFQAAAAVACASALAASAAAQTTLAENQTFDTFFPFTPGQSATLVPGGQFNNLAFNFYDGAALPVANGTLFLLTQAYGGFANALSAATPGYLGQSLSISGGRYLFDPGLTVVGGTQYFFYANQSVGNIATDTINSYSGGQSYFTVGPFFDPFAPFDFRFLLTGNSPLLVMATAPVAGEVTFFVTDVGAIFSTLQSGLPMAVAQRQLTFNALRTALNDVGGRLFAMRAGLLLGDDDNNATAGAAGPTGRELSTRGSDGKTIADGKVLTTAAEEPFRRWSLYSMGNFGNFDVDDTGSLPGYQSDVWVGTVGAEYRFTRHLMFGLAASYVNSDTDLGRNLGGVRNEGAVFSAYTSAVWRHAYVDLLYAFGALDADITRHTLTGRNAAGDANSRTHALQFNTGYNFELGPIRTGPLASLEYLNGDQDGYRERGGGSAALIVPGQNFDSLVSRIGWQVSTTIPGKWGKITPQIRASWDHEYLDSAESVSVGLQQSPFATITGTNVTRGGKFSASTNTAKPGRDYLNVGAGLSAQFGECVTLTMQYETHLFQDQASAHMASVKLGLAF